MHRWFYVLTAAALLVLSLTGMPQDALLLAMAFAAGELGSLFSAELFFTACATEPDEKKLQSGRADALILMCIGCLILYGLQALIGNLPEYLVNCAVGFVIGNVITQMLRIERAKSTVIFLSAAIALALALARFSPYGYYKSATFVIVLACVAGIPKSMLFQLDKPSGAILKCLPEALRQRGIYVIPAAALCLGLYCAGGSVTVAGYAAGLTVFSLLASDTDVTKSEAERRPALWCAGALFTAAAVCGMDAWAALYVGFAVCAAMVTVSCTRKMLPLLLTAALAACVLLPMPLRVIGALACTAAVFAVNGRALYAVYIELRARLLRRRAEKRSDRKK